MFDKKLTACPVCRSPELRHFLTDWRGVAIDACRRCSFLFMNPRYSDAYLAAYYAEYEALDDNRRWDEALAYGHDYHLSQIEGYRRPGTLLDLGCGYGHLLAAARERGWRVTGQDVSTVSCRETSRRLGSEVRSGNFLEMDFDGRFDCVTMNQVLEHVKDPRAFVKKIHMLLQPDGVFFAAAPNIWSLSNRLKYGFERLGLRRAGVGKYFDSSHHLNYFTPRSLTGLLSRAGFVVVALRNGHKVRPGQSRAERFLNRHLTERFVPRSTFFVIARKSPPYS